MEALFKQLLIDDSISKVALLGSGCSGATETTADLSHYFNITQVRNFVTIINRNDLPSNKSVNKVQCVCVCVWGGGGGNKPSQTIVVAAAIISYHYCWSHDI